MAIGDEVSVYVDLIARGRSSMRIAVEACRRERHTEERHKVTEAVFTFVAIGLDRRPVALPPTAAHSAKPTARPARAEPMTGQAGARPPIGAQDTLAPSEWRAASTSRINASSPSESGISMTQRSPSGG